MAKKMLETPSVDPKEIARFNEIAGQWWNPKGTFAALQAMTPARVRYIKQQAARLLQLPHKQHDSNPLKGVTILDIGCGGGLLAEPLARLGGRVTALDASITAIEVAKSHAMASGLAIDYHAISAEEMAEKLAGEMAEQDKHFDLIIASEVIEHVQDRQSFLATMARFGHKDKPSMVVVTTINRSLAGVVLAKYAAEYILKLTPKHTHDAAKFVRPSELIKEAAKAAIIIDDITGIRPSIGGGFTLGGRPLINYAAAGLIRR